MPTSPPYMSLSLSMASHPTTDTSKTREGNGRATVVEDQAFGVQIRQTPSHLLVRIHRIVD